jgi:hypothetical protein
MEHERGRFRAPARALDLPTMGRSLIRTPGWDMTWADQWREES